MKVRARMGQYVTRLIIVAACAIIAVFASLASFVWLSLSLFWLLREELSSAMAAASVGFGSVIFAALLAYGARLYVSHRRRSTSATDSAASQHRDFASARLGDVQAIVKNLEQPIKKHPYTSLLISLGLGFSLGFSGIDRDLLRGLVETLVRKPGADG